MEETSLSLPPESILEIFRDRYTMKFRLSQALILLREAREWIDYMGKEDCEYLNQELSEKIKTFEKNCR